MTGAKVLAVWMLAFLQACRFATIMQGNGLCRWVAVRQELGRDFTLRVYFAPEHSNIPRAPLVVFVDLLTLKCSPSDEVGSVIWFLRGTLTDDGSLEYVSLGEFRALWQNRDRRSFP
jgi:hypothetical protein